MRLFKRKAVNHHAGVFRVPRAGLPLSLSWRWTGSMKPDRFRATGATPSLTSSTAGRAARRRSGTPTRTRRTSIRKCGIRSALRDRGSDDALPLQAFGPFRATVAAVFQSGRRDLNSGPLVPQAAQRSGVKSAVVAGSGFPPTFPSMDRYGRRFSPCPPSRTFGHGLGTAEPPLDSPPSTQKRAGRSERQNPARPRYSSRLSAAMVARSRPSSNRPQHRQRGNASHPRTRARRSPREWRQAGSKPRKRLRGKAPPGRARDPEADGRTVTATADGRNRWRNCSPQGGSTPPATRSAPAPAATATRSRSARCARRAGGTNAARR
jgi:hypothetical protein